MDRRSFIIPSQQALQTSCGEEECLCEEEIVIANNAQQRIKPSHLLSITLLAFLTAAVFLMVENKNANAIVLSQIKANAIPCSVSPVDDLILNKHSAPRDNNSNCPHHLSIGFLLNNDSKRKKFFHC